MKISVILLALLTWVVAFPMDDAPIDWKNMEENDYIPPALEEYYLIHKPAPKDTTDQRIVGGQMAPANALPHQVGLAIANSNGALSWCGGSIISENFILTAAHCTDDAQSATIIMGAHDRESPAETGRLTLKLDRSGFIVHNSWNRQQMINDIALIKLTNPITFSENIQPISLPTRSHAAQTFEGHTALISGWGNYETQGLSRYLRYTQSRVVSNGMCKMYYGPMVHSSTICLDGTEARGTCHGDSGGPLIVNTAESGSILVGLTSFGNPYSCLARWPTAYTRVASFLDWISSNTGITIKN